MRSHDIWYNASSKKSVLIPSASVIHSFQTRGLRKNSVRKKTAGQRCYELRYAWRRLSTPEALPSAWMVASVVPGASNCVELARDFPDGSPVEKPPDLLAVLQPSFYSHKRSSDLSLLWLVCSERLARLGLTDTCKLNHDPNLHSSVRLSCISYPVRTRHLR